MSGQKNFYFVMVFLIATINESAAGVLVETPPPRRKSGKTNYKVTGNSGVALSVFSVPPW